MPEGMAIMTTIKTAPKKIVARYALAPLPRLKCPESDVDHCGTYTNNTAPHTIPMRLPLPAMTIAASNWMESVSGNSPVFTTPVDSARNAAGETCTCPR